MAPRPPPAHPLTPRPRPAAEGDLLADQAASVKEFAEFVAQLRRVGPGLGVFQFDQQMGGGAAA